MPSPGTGSDARWESPWVYGEFASSKRMLKRTWKPLASRCCRQRICATSTTRRNCSRVSTRAGTTCQSSPKLDWSREVVAEEVRRAVEIRAKNLYAGGKIDRSGEREKFTRSARNAARSTGIIHFLCVLASSKLGSFIKLKLPRNWNNQKSNRSNYTRTYTLTYTYTIFISLAFVSFFSFLFFFSFLGGYYFLSLFSFQLLFIRRWKIAFMRNVNTRALIVCDLVCMFYNICGNAGSKIF